MRGYWPNMGPSLFLLGCIQNPAVRYSLAAFLVPCQLPTHTGRRLKDSSLKKMKGPHRNRFQTTGTPKEGSGKKRDYRPPQIGVLIKKQGSLLMES